MAEIEPSNQRDIRRRNLAVVLQRVADHGPRSRATIALETTLNKSTVSSLVTELIDLGLLTERGAERRGTAGRPGLVVDVSRDGVVALGLEINVDYLAVQAMDLAGGSRYRALETADNRPRAVEEVIDRLAALANAALAEVRAQGLRPIGATVAVPGLVEVERGSLLVAPNLGWKDVEVVDLLRARVDMNLPVTADNEANLGALAELWEGAARGLRDVVYVSGEIGVGAGVVIGGELYRGFRGFGGEFGHITVEPEGRRCACGGRGCLETRASLEALRVAAGAPGPDVSELVERARAGDAAAVEALADAGRWLGIALSSVINLLNPEAVVLGGYFAPIAEWLRPSIDGELRERVLSAGAGLPRLLASTLGSEAAARGAAAISLRRVLADPGLVAELAAA